MKKYEFALIAGLLLSLVITPAADFAKRCDDSTNSVLRLHILANSNSPADQRLKYIVRDSILEQTADIFSGEMTMQQMEQAAQEAIPQIEQAANAVLSSNGSSQRATASVKRLYFGTRSYNGIIFPAGNYEAVQVLIGEAGGKNWWCVMYPPMCLPAAAADKDRELDIKSLDTKPRYKMAFATVELAEKLKERLQKEFGAKDE